MLNGNADNIEKTPLVIFIESLGDGGKIKLARQIKVSKSTVTRWTMPLKDKKHRTPTLKNALEICQYATSLNWQLTLKDLIVG